MTLVTVDSSGIASDVWAEGTNPETGETRMVSGFRKVYRVTWNNDHPITKAHTLKDAYAFTGSANAFVECMETVPVVDGVMSLSAAIKALTKSKDKFRLIIPTETGALVVTTHSGNVVHVHCPFENKDGGYDTLYFGGAASDQVGRTSDLWLGVFLDAYREERLPTLDYARYSFLSGELTTDRLLNDAEAKEHRTRRLRRTRRCRLIR